MKNIGLILLLSLISLRADAYPDSLKGLEYRNLAGEFLIEDCLDSVAHYKTLSLEIFKQNQDLGNWINVFKYLGRFYRDQTNNPEFAINEFQNATEENLWRSPNDDEEWKVLGWLYVNIAYTHWRFLGDYKKARTYYEKAKSILSEKLAIEDLLVGQYLFRELGNIYTRLGDYSAAQVLHKKFIDISINEKQYGKAAEAYSDLGLCYFATQQFDQAIEMYKTGLLLPDLGKRPKALLYFNLTKAYKKIEDYDLALEYALKAKREFEALENNNSQSKGKIWLGGILVEISSIYSEKGQYEKAELHLMQAYDLFKQTYINPQRREFANLFASFGDLYLDWQKFDLALEYHRKALQCVISEFNPSDLLQNPDPSHFYAETSIIDVLNGKAGVLIQYYEQNPELAYLETALDCYELIYEVEKQLRRSYHYESSKLFNIETSRIRSEEAIDLALQLYELTGQEKFSRKAFEFAERSKSILLLEAFQKADATAIAGIPQNLIEEERAMQEEIAFAEKELFNAKAKAETSELIIKDLDDQLLSLRQKYTDWIQAIETRYPQYYNLKYNFNTASIAEVQRILQQENRAMIEYFVGDSSIYTFVISADRFEVLQQPKDFPLTEWVINLRNDIEKFQFSGPDRDVLCTNYTEKAISLYGKLMAPLEAFNLPKKLTIIPGGVLGYLPFDALLTSAPNKTCTFQHYPYLVRKHSLSFGYSATLQYALSQNKINSNRIFAGFAPEFQGLGGFDALNFNIEGLESIKPIVKGDLFLGSEATLENFKEYVSQYGIIQLATHAEANTSTGDFSFIVFADGKGGYDSLFVKDLYLLDLMAEMVVLSACETAVGKLHKGEGIISLARGFLQSGAQSVVTTLWSINDETNKLLMQEFYKQIKKGKSKDEALQLAKVKQIENADQMYAHPVFWAAFAPMGDMKAIYPGVQPVMLYLGGIFLVLLLIFLFGFRNKPIAKSGIIRKIIQQKPWSKVGL